MTGARPLTRQEQASLEVAITGRHYLRDRCLVALGCNTGFRISELLSLNLGDVLQAGAIVSQVEVRRRNMKGKVKSRGVVLNEDAVIHLREWIEELNCRGGLFPHTPLFCASTLKRLDRFQAYRIIRTAAQRAGLSGRIATHSLRKSFAARTYNHYQDEVAAGKRVDAFRMTSKALGHSSIESTDKYLALDQAAVDAAVFAIGRISATKSQNATKQGPN